MPARIDRAMAYVCTVTQEPPIPRRGLRAGTSAVMILKIDYDDKVHMLSRRGDDPEIIDGSGQGHRIEAKIYLRVVLKDPDIEVLIGRVIEHTVASRL